MLVTLQTFIDDEKSRNRFEEIYEKYNEDMIKIAYTILKNTHDAEEATQNAWLQIIKHFEKVFEIPCEELWFWIICIVKRESYMIYKKNHETEPYEEWHAPTEDFSKVVDYNSLVELFTKLPETYKLTLEMKFLLQYTDKEIGESLGISETAVSSRINRGRKILKEIVIKEGYRNDRG